MINLLKRHINWTLLLSTCILSAICYPSLISLSNSDSTVGFWIVTILFVGIYYGIFDWVLSAKGWKSPKEMMNFGWFILWLMGIIGVVVLLLLKNKNNPQASVKNDF